MTDQPSRFHASPAEIDAFLREHFAEDALLNFYRAAGDEILDEALSHGREHRGVMESRNCKHVYLSGMTDVMEAIWDFRYYPAKLPALATYDRPFNPPRENRAVPEDDARQKMHEARLRLHPEDSTYHPGNTRLPSPKEGTLNVFLRKVDDGWDAVRDDDRSRLVAVAYTLPDIMDKLNSFPMTIHVVNVPTVAEWGQSQAEKYMREAAQKDQEPDPQPCYRDKAHDPHKWLKGRRPAYCPGTGKETP